MKEVRFRILIARIANLHMVGIVEQGRIYADAICAEIVKNTGMVTMIACAYLNLLRKKLKQAGAGTMRNTKKNDSNYMDWHIGTDKYSVNMHI